MCEDYPCCGHELNDCPDSKGRMKCVQCGKRMSAKNTSSICAKCLRRMRDLSDYYGDDYLDHDYSMNY